MAGSREPSCDGPEVQLVVGCEFVDQSLTGSSDECSNPGRVAEHEDFVASLRGLVSHRQHLERSGHRPTGENGQIGVLAG